MKYEDKKVSETDKKIQTTYHEKRIGKTVFRVTSIYKGEVDLAKTLENLIIDAALSNARQTAPSQM